MQTPQQCNVSLWYTFGGGTKLIIKGPTVKPSVSLLPPSSLHQSEESASLLCLLSAYSPQGASEAAFMSFFRAGFMVELRTKTVCHY
ncbi:hypothetical protein Q7C36_014720 [Tachysurus vachellii]|uniref:Uncharacterized protein n=1 Tax=Tachysurus vachellii TaxID=175792 RepID=A0AA88MEN4_TACVA|nr:hypothetical protein Q7C36_014720 [Tachysurus vachellii]